MTQKTDQHPTFDVVTAAAERPGGSGWARWLRRAALTGALLSLLVHLGVMMAAYLVRVGHPGGEGGGETPSVVEFAVMTQAEFAAAMAEQPSLDSAAVPELADQSVPDLSLLDESATEAIESLSEQPLDIDIEIGGGDVSAGGGDGSGLGGGGGGGASRVCSAIDIRAVAEPFIRGRAIRHLEKGRVVILAAGTGNPFFTTDTCAALRATELECDVLLKATKVDGVYDSDPAKNPDAKRYEKLTFDEALDRQLRVMDMTALAMCREQRINVRVFDFKKPGNIRAVVEGQQIGTLITP